MTKIALVQMNSTVGDLLGNAERVFHFARCAYQRGARIVVTPELALTGYSPEDLLLRNSFYLSVRKALSELALKLMEFPDLHVIVGHPLLQDNKRFNAASLLVNGKTQATYLKQNLPNEKVFDEKRYFESGQEACVFELDNVRFGIVICADAWTSLIPEQAKAAGVQVLLDLNASPYHTSKQQRRYEVMRDNVVLHGMALVYVNLVGGQDDLLFDGNSFVLDSQGQVKACLKHAEEDMQLVEFIGANPQKSIIAPTLAEEEQVYQALVLGLRDYISKNGFSDALIGLSGGVDSALTLAIAVDALGADKVRAVMMPSPYTAEISLIDAREMAKNWGVRYDEIPIDPCFDAFTTTLAQEFDGVDVNNKMDKTEENIQARIRGTLLMALSNKYGSIVLATGNKSEMAVGYCTLYGDMVGGFAVLKDVPKTLVYRLCAYRNSVGRDPKSKNAAMIPARILTRAPSAELRPNQTDQDSLPSYDVLDGIVRLYMEEDLTKEEIIAAGYKKEDVDYIIHLIKVNEYKRRQSPIGIRITPRSFCRDWRFPITSQFQD